MKIALYSCNTGNYRNELNTNNFNKIKLDKKIDYFLFTDIDLNIKDCKWNIHKVILRESYNFLNSNRNTAKYIKFCIQDVLKSYDYIIWCDTKSFDYIQSLSYEKIKEYIYDVNKNIYLIKHHRRKKPLEELEFTLKKNKEKKEYAEEFEKKIQNINFTSILPDTTMIIRKVDNRINNIFTNVYDELIDNKLCRDQNIVQFSFYNMKCESDIHYFSSKNEFSKLFNE